jgi:DNA polymerase
MVELCRRCDLWRDATQGVAGEGPARARLMLVGEQPGDQEDLAGRPFVGPAGQMLDKALAEAAVPRGEAYVTNAVKHFKHEPRGKRRLHKTPDAGEISACRWWLEREIEIIRPQFTVALGATALRSLTGLSGGLMNLRGTLAPSDLVGEVFVTVHPSSILRTPPEQREAAYAAFVADLRKLARLMA